MALGVWIEANGYVRGHVTSELVKASYNKEGAKEGRYRIRI